jgi:shikimate dehydrogenase
MFNFESISLKTQVCAVIGNPIGHSLSPAIHNAAFQELSLDYVYIACQVEDVKAALDGMRALENFRGMSVTIPHKIEAMKHVDEVAEVDRSIGSINTIIHENGELYGFSTDGPGALKALADAGVTVDGKNVLLLGCGGAARAVSFTLARNTALKEMRMLDIDEQMLRQLSADFIIHCTPIGMHPKEDASLVPPDLFRPGQVVFDIVYTPLETKLLKEAKASGLQVISGVEMFVNQAVLQFERFTNAAAPVEVMRNVVLERLKNN